MQIQTPVRGSRQQGAALVEFAFVLLPLLLLTIGTLLYGLVFVTQQAMAFAAQRGADAIVQADPDAFETLDDYCQAKAADEGTTLAEQRVESVIPAVGLLENPSVVSEAVSSGEQFGCLVTVRKKSPLQIPFLRGSEPLTLQGVGFVPVEFP